MKLVVSLTSPYARKIRIALAEKGLPFTLEVDIPWLPETTVPSYNPLGKVPALVGDDGEVWYDSPVIALYLETLGGIPLLPAERTASLPVRQTEALADGIADAAVAAFLEGRHGLLEALGDRDRVGLGVEDRRVAVGVGERLGQRALRQGLDLAEHVVDGVAGQGHQMLPITPSTR